MKRRWNGNGSGEDDDDVGGVAAGGVVAGARHVAGMNRAQWEQVTPAKRPRGDLSAFSPSPRRPADQRAVLAAAAPPLRRRRPRSPSMEQQHAAQPSEHKQDEYARRLADQHNTTHNVRSFAASSHNKRLPLTVPTHAAQAAPSVDSTRMDVDVEVDLDAHRMPTRRELVLSRRAARSLSLRRARRQTQRDALTSLSLNARFANTGREARRLASSWLFRSSANAPSAQSQSSICEPLGRSYRRTPPRPLSRTDGSSSLSPPRTPVPTQPQPHNPSSPPQSPLLSHIAPSTAHRFSQCTVANRPLASAGHPIANDLAAPSTASSATNPPSMASPSLSMPPCAASPASHSSSPSSVLSSSPPRSQTPQPTLEQRVQQRVEELEARELAQARERDQRSMLSAALEQRIQQRCQHKSSAQLIAEFCPELVSEMQKLAGTAAPSALSSSSAAAASAHGGSARPRMSSTLAALSSVGMGAGFSMDPLSRSLRGRGTLFSSSASTNSSSSAASSSSPSSVPPLNEHSPHTRAALRKLMRRAMAQYHPDKTLEYLTSAQQQQQQKQRPQDETSIRLEREIVFQHLHRAYEALV